MEQVELLKPVQLKGYQGSKGFISVSQITGAEKHFRSESNLFYESSSFQKNEDSVDIKQKVNLLLAHCINIQIYSNIFAIILC